MAAKTKGVGEGDVDGHLARLVGDVIQITLWIWIFEIDGGGTTSWAMAKTVATASTPPDPPNRCPVMDLVELMATL